MKPIGRSSGSGQAADGCAAAAVTPAAAAVRPRIQSCESARLEDIIGVSPVASVSTSTIVAGPTAPAASQRNVAEQLSAQLRQAVTSADTMETLQSSIARVLADTGQADLVGWFQPAGNRIGEDSQLTVWHGSSDTPADIDELARTALQNETSVCQTSAAHTLSLLPVTPAQACLVVRQPTEIARGNALSLEYIAAVLAARQTETRRDLAERAARQSAALVELLSLVACESGERQGQQRLVDELQRHLQADSVILGTHEATRPVCRVRAISNTPEIDRHAPRTQRLEAVLQESTARAEASMWPAAAAEQRYALLAHEQLAADSGWQSVLACPLRAESGEMVGSLVVGLSAKNTGRPTAGAIAAPVDAPTTGAIDVAATDVPQADPAATAAQHLNFLRAASRSVGTTVAALRRSHQSAFARWWQSCRRKLRGNTGMAVLVGMTLLAAVALIPMDYRVRCEAQLQPVSRRYVAAPFDAPLKNCLVDPGDIVRAGQTLARLDGREVRWELAGLRADMKKAEKEHSAHLSRQAFGEAAVARHEVERLRNRSGLLADREQNLEVRSPIDGVVVMGNLRDREGVPLEMGQSLFEIAPLDQLVMEVGIPEDDIPYVEAGMTIRLRLHALPATPVEATIVRIHPRAELRDNDNVFVAEAVLDNSDQTLRPGMKGAALVSTGRRPLGWNLLHKPVAHVAGWLGW